MPDRYIEISGAREHNLKNIDLKIPKDRLTVITGISGSGKSSLAFDTIYAEGQRRYLDTLSSYARQFIGNMERPDVEQISGLSPVISIEQKTTGWNPRSTVGTVTELYDMIRLLYARVGEAYSYASGEKMVKYTEEQVVDQLLKDYDGHKITILAPSVRGRKGHYRELLDHIRKMGYTKVRIDGELQSLKSGMQLDRYKTHDIEVVVDRMKVDPQKEKRLTASVETAMKMGNELLFILTEKDEMLAYSKQLMDPGTGLSYEEPSPNTFSFNSPYGACPNCKGLGYIHSVDMDKVIPDGKKTIHEGGLAPLGEARENQTFKQLRKIANHFGFTFATPVGEIPEEALKIILEGGDSRFELNRKRSHDWTYSLATDGLVKMLEEWYKSSSSDRVRNWAEKFMSIQNCPVCEGTRLKKEALYFKIADTNIAELSTMDFDELYEWFEHVRPKLDERQLLIGEEILKEISIRLKFLLHVGLNYLNMDRPARSLSGGESQRTRLATQIGSALTGITYILDEPSIGLHSRDNNRLIKALKELTTSGNTVIVVEHDKDIMLASDYLIDLGPGAGKLGGELVAEGAPDEFIKTSSMTAAYLNREEEIALPEERRKGNGKKLELINAVGHNLQGITIDIPLGTFVCVTGVSGSGKSSLINETLYPILRQHFYRSIQQPLGYDRLKGMGHIDKVIEIDQSPIGRTPRSNPATYTGVFTDIRKLFSDLPEARIRGYKPGRFSFNVKGGRCETCGGAGKKVIEMNFLPDVLVDCETCQGRRYNRETLEIHYRGKNINDVLEMSVSEAAQFFENIPRIARKLETIADVGLGYITLGQQATTLSGGEAQRVKLSEELSKRDTGQTLYIMDEPTTGLHFQDIRHLLIVIQKLVDKGNTVIIIEHNMDVIKVADHIIDLGPEGGKYGGRVVATGTPEEVMEVEKSLTGQWLRKELKGENDR